MRLEDLKIFTLRHCSVYSDGIMGGGNVANARIVLYKKKIEHYTLLFFLFFSFLFFFKKKSTTLYSYNKPDVEL